MQSNYLESYIQQQKYRIGSLFVLAVISFGYLKISDNLVSTKTAQTMPATQIAQGSGNHPAVLGVSAIPEEEDFPQNTTLGELPVYIIRFLPEDANRPGYLDPAETGSDMRIADMQTRLEGFDQTAINDLTTGSVYRGYKPENAASPPAIRYRIAGYSPIYKEKMQRGLYLETNKEGLRLYRPDYRQILNRENVCDLVDNQGVKQIWIWGYHHYEIVPTESNLSMGRTSQAFFNYRDRNFGDISNSERTDDLPQCETTYAVFVYNFTRGVGEMLEDHSHHAEALFNALDRVHYLPGDRWSQALFWGRWVGSDTSNLTKNPGCGWTHRPPNETTSEEYKWYKTNYVDSDCMDWLPDGGGAKTPINCTTWTKSSNCPDDGGEAFKVWWYQNFPGLNNGLSYQGRPLRNWWEVIYDFDKVLLLGGGLYRPQQNVVYTISDSFDNTIIIEKNVGIKPYDVLELRYVTSSGSYYKFLSPECVDNRCYFRFQWDNAPVGSPFRWNSWNIMTDLLVPYRGDKATIVDNSAKWSSAGASTNYHAEFTRDMATPTPSANPTPTPTPTPTPISTPIPCLYTTDLTGDGKANIFDYSKLLQNFGQTGQGVIGDINCNNEVDIYDYSYLISHFTVE